MCIAYLHVAGVRSRSSKGSQQFLSEGIAAHASGHIYGRSKPCSLHSLVRALSAGGGTERIAYYGFSEFRGPFGYCHKVHHETADYEYSGFLIHAS